MSSDDESPEAFSFSASKKAAKGEAQALNEFHVQEKKKLKDRRRVRDRNLKERKVQSQAANPKQRSKGKEKAVDSVDEGEHEERSELEARMERAMREADEESNDDDDDDSDFKDGENDASFPMEGIEDDDSSGEDNDNSEGDEEMDASSESGDEEKEGETSSSKSSSRSQKLDYLPDHLFASAFAQPKPISSKSKAKGKSKQSDSNLSTKKKRKQSKRSAKDLAVGGRTIRTLAPAQTRSSVSLPKTLTPTSQMNHFVGRSLNLRGEAANAKLRGWERRSANVGVMKRLGPAAQFVRG
ncbi:hypothetical protein BDY19DRAFT_970042 [Irpex rosettiformis]|uniref:Uncharacterized protein n=1 Tax=Irpex rosettiformis TaxID=378272 RepID=A0ACB8TR91_9APHY|nr:hypothetical protein BDY19DRAFT_970042 [Irpex rosettiformis]